MPTSSPFIQVSRIVPSFIAVARLNVASQVLIKYGITIGNRPASNRPTERKWTSVYLMTGAIQKMAQMVQPDILKIKFQ